jgi:hypothetical protein
VTQLLADGRLVAGGPFTDGSGALFIYEAASLADAEKIVADDPYRVGGLMARHVRPGGIICFQDVSITQSRTVPPLPLAGQCLDWLTAAFLAGGREPDFGDRLPAILRAAGFPAPQVAATLPAGGLGSLNYPHLAAGVAVLLPLIEASGAARRDDVAIETLPSRLREEALAAAATLYSAELIGAWAQTPPGHGVLLVSELERGNHADLLEDVEQIELVPVLDELAVLDPPDVDGTHLDPVPCRRYSPEGTVVGASVGESPDDPVSRDHQAGPSMRRQERRARERQQRRQVILDAARELAEAEGWESVTTRRLADRIEYSQPVLYSHFEGKDAIVSAVALEGFSELSAILRDAREKAGSPDVELRAVASPGPADYARITRISVWP